MSAPTAGLHPRPPHVRLVPADRSDAETSEASESEVGPARAQAQPRGSLLAGRAHTPSSEKQLLNSPGSRRRSGGGSGTGDLTDGGYESSSSVGSAARARRARKTAFRARSSRLDYETLDREGNSFRGFFVLFWMGFVWYTLTTVYHSLRTDGVPVRLQLFFTFSQDAVNLAISDAVLVASCFVPAVLQRLIRWRLLPLSSAHVLQHVWQGLWFGAVVFWTFYRDWPWSHSGFFTMHGIAMLMKQHSYMATNTELHYKKRLVDSMDKELAELRKVAIANASAVSYEATEEARARESRIQFLVSELEALRPDLVRPNVQFPNNITFVNFAYYMLVPTLVYEIEYPRTTRFRPVYFIEKVIATLFTFSLLYITVEHYIFPILAMSRQIDFISSIMYLMMPFMIGYLLIFYIIFECICNAFAELTYFADRDFYDDWWNSTTFDEFARKWNKPVHEFLLRHVYLESMSSYKLSKQNATLLTFFVSSCFHEVVMAVTGKRVRMYFFILQMFQIPLIYFARIPFVRRQKLFGNALFWFGMFLGPPLLGAAYAREHWYYYIPQDAAANVTIPIVP